MLSIEEKVALAKSTSMEILKKRIADRLQELFSQEVRIGSDEISFGSNLYLRRGHWHPLALVNYCQITFSEREKNLEIRVKIHMEKTVYLGPAILLGVIVCLQFLPDLGLRLIGTGVLGFAAILMRVHSFERAKDYVVEIIKNAATR